MRKKQNRQVLFDWAQLPADLGPTGKDLWQSNINETAINGSQGRRDALYQVCVAADRAAQCAKQIARDGLMIKGQNGLTREHPLVKIEIANRAFVMRGLARLGVLKAPDDRPVGRPATGANCGVSFQQLREREL